MEANLASDVVSRARDRLGTVVDGKWRLDTLLGVGGMASVYAASHRNGKRAALKLLHPEVALDARVKARFLREGYVANKIDHPSAVSILDDDESGGFVFLVMELLEGETLESKYPNGGMPPKELLTMVAQLLDLLAVAHSKNVVHRDLKPGNLFVTLDGSLKVLDFGIARLRELAAPDQAPNATTVHAMGTPGFMPPEQARGLWEEVDARSDLWAVGATMFSLLTGRFVHDGRTVNEMLLAAMTKPAPKLETVMPDAPLPLRELVDRAMAFERADRYQTASEMLEAVRSAYRAITGETLALAPRAPSIGRRSLPSLDAEASSAPTLPEEGLTEAAYAPTERRPAVDTEPRARTMTTTGGASVSSEPSPSVPRGRRPLWVAIALGAAVVALAAAFMRGPASSAPAAGPVASAPPPPPSTTAVAAPIETDRASTTSAPPSDAPPAIATSAAAASSASPVRTAAPAVRRPPPTRSSASPATTPAPSASIDIYGRRR